MRYFMVSFVLAVLLLIQSQVVLSSPLPQSQFVDQVDIPSTGQTVASNVILASQKKYAIVITGIYRYDIGEVGQLADAQYREDDLGQWRIRYNAVQFNGSRLSADSFDLANHSYTFNVMGSGQAINFRIYDDPWGYDDNEGSLTAAIYAVDNNEPTPIPSPQPTTAPVKPPLLLVHGIQIGSPTGYNCNQDVGRYNQDGTVNTFSNLSGWLNEDYDVWIAHMTTNMFGTPALQENAACLQQQINEVYQRTGQQKIIMVAHSMGGIISRNALSLMPDKGNKVTKLYTLGSPHAGLNIIHIAPFLPYRAGAIFCKIQVGGCQMASLPMVTFNLFNPKATEIEYTFVAGDDTPIFPLGGILFFTEGWNDGFIGSYSALGWPYPLRQELPPNWAKSPKRYLTDETHAAGLGGHAYMVARSFAEGGGSDGRSQAYHCLMWLEGHEGRSSFCRDGQSRANPNRQNPTSLSEKTVNIDGQLNSNGSIAHQIQVDTTGHTTFYVGWTEGNINVTLTQPDGQLIDPTRAASDTNIEYSTNAASEFLPAFATYSFNTTQAGTWTLNLQASQVNSTDYTAFVAMETPRVLTAKFDNDHYNIGDVATLEASLTNNSTGISGANVTAQIERADNQIETITLIDQGNGLYRANYAIPQVPGYLQATVIATGSDNGSPFSRQANTLITIAPTTVQLSNSYNDYLDGSDKTLVLEIGLTVNQAGRYDISANLAKGTTLIANATSAVMLNPGNQIVQLRFSSREIYNSQQNGPYTVADLLVADLQNGGVAAVQAANVYLTQPYNYTDFKPAHTIYLPIVIK